MNPITVIMPNRQEEGLASHTDAYINIPPGVPITEPLKVGLIRQPSLFYFLSKRFIDMFLSVFGIIVLMPVLLLIALCIKLGERGRVLHFREIIGKNERGFDELMFRTMIIDEDMYMAT